MGFFEMRDLPFEVCQDSGIQSKMGAGFGCTWKEDFLPSLKLELKAEILVT